MCHNFVSSYIFVGQLLLHTQTCTHKSMVFKRMLTEFKSFTSIADGNQYFISKLLFTGVVCKFEGVEACSSLWHLDK